MFFIQVNFVDQKEIRDVLWKNLRNALEKYSKTCHSFLLIYKIPEVVFLLFLIPLGQAIVRTILNISRDIYSYQ